MGTLNGQFGIIFLLFLFIMAQIYPRPPDPNDGVGKGLLDDLQLNIRDFVVRVYLTDSHFCFSYFIIHFHAPYKHAEGIKSHCERDTDIIRRMLLEKKTAEEFICTLHEETKPPSERFVI